MNKQEFCDHTAGTAKYEDISELDWEIINTVYTYHPLISNTNGKDEIAAFYNQGGLGLLQDMFPTADSIGQNESFIQKKTVEIERMTRAHEKNLKELDEIFQDKTDSLKNDMLDALNDIHKVTNRYK